MAECSSVRQECWSDSFAFVQTGAFIHRHQQNRQQHLTNLFVHRHENQSLRLVNSSENESRLLSESHAELGKLARRAAEVMGITDSSRELITMALRFDRVHQSSKKQDKSSSGVLHFIRRVTGTAALSTFMSGEDIVWLLLFLVGADKARCACSYVFCKILMWFIACMAMTVVSTFGIMHGGLPFQAIAEICSTVLLAVLSAKFFYESPWLRGEAQHSTTQDLLLASLKEIKFAHEDQNDEAVYQCGFPVKIHESAKQELAYALRAKQMTRSSLVLIALACNIDSVGVFMPIMFSGVYTPTEVLVGDIAAGAIIALVALILSFTNAAHAVAETPLCAIMGLITLAVGVDTCFTCRQQLLPTVAPAMY